MPTALFTVITMIFQKVHMPPTALADMARHIMHHKTCQNPHLYPSIISSSQNTHILPSPFSFPNLTEPFAPHRIMSADLFPQGSIPLEWHDSFVGSDKIITLVEWLCGELSKHNLDEISTLHDSFSEYIDGYCHPSHIYHSTSDEESDHYIGVLYAAHSVKEHYKYLTRVISLYHLAPHFSIRVYDAREAVRETFEQWVPPIL